MPSSLLGGDRLKTQPGLEESYSLLVDSPSPLGYTYISFRKDMRGLVFILKWDFSKLQKSLLGW